MKQKYAKPPNGDVFRLTLQPSAYATAVSKGSRWAGFSALKRLDGRWDVFVPMSSINLLKQLANEGEDLSDAVLRILLKNSEPTPIGGNHGTDKN